MRINIFSSDRTERTGCQKPELLVVPPFFVNPLTVAEGKKLRLVLILGTSTVVSRLNTNSNMKTFTRYPKFWMKDTGFLTWDLKSGYHHVDICLDHQNYLGFAWPFSGIVRYFTLQFFLSALVEPAFASLSSCAR